MSLEKAKQMLTVVKWNPSISPDARIQAEFLVELIEEVRSLRNDLRNERGGQNP